MKTLILAAIFGITAFTAIAPAHADVYVNGYTRQNGTYVQPHVRSNPDAYPMAEFRNQQ